MGAVEIIRGLAAFERRAGGSDTERRAATWLRDELAGGGETRIDTFWSRPNSALAHAWHVGLGLIGSLVTVGSARVGGILILVALVSLIADVLFGVSLGRRLTPERASQNVIVTPGAATGAATRAATGTAQSGTRVRLILTANYDAGRAGLVYRDTPRTVSARARRVLGNLGPGWLGWAAIALIWVEVVAIARVGGASGTGIGLVQLLPTAALVLMFAALLDVGSADVTPAANDNASGVAVAIALTRALTTAPLRNADIELVLQGASDGTGAGLRHHLRTHRETLRRTNTVVLGVGAAGAGHVAWFQSDGSLLPLRAFPRLRGLAASIAAGDPGMGFTPHHHRGASPSLPARLRRIPAITIGAVDARGVVPRSHQMTDVADALDERAIGRVVEAGMLLIDAIDGSLAAGGAARTTTGTAAARP